MNLNSSSTEDISEPKRARTKGRFLVRLGRVTLALLVLLVLLLSAGAVYQAIAANRDLAAYPPPGQLVDVGGYRLHLYSMGNEQPGPTVVMVGCAACTSAHWGWVQPEVASIARAVAFDRAGFGWSDTGPPPRDAAQNAAELHAALEKAGIPGPYVMVGYSYGGSVVRVFTGQYPDEVAGMVLVDPRHPDMDRHMPPEVAAANESTGSLIVTLGLLNRFGFLRLTGLGEEQSADLPPRQAAENSAFYYTPRYWGSILAEGSASQASDEQVRSAGVLGDRPLVVLSAGTAWLSPGAQADEARRVLTGLHQEMTGLSDNSLHLVVEEATHSSLVNNREHARATVTAIRDVVEAVRTGASLTE